MKFCIHCGTQLADGGQFCTNCGAAVAAEQPVQTAVPEQDTVETVAEQAQAVEQSVEQPEEPAVEQPVYTAIPVQQPPVPPKANGFAIAALVLGISSFIAWICCMHVLTCVLAVVFGIIALSQIKKTGAPGRGMAITGLVCGILAFVIVLVGFFFIGFLSEWATEYDDYDYYDYYDGGYEDFYDEFYYYNSEFDHEDFLADLETT